ncbi:MULTISPECIES: 6-carboxytetrahydropterin synthase [unclassified Paenibacillus]|uniref:6-carboxytetrahydropterin synthase n=1 Tax=unclassified Paenibacillus TaxID=185978 RepID=UPI001AE8D59A|nr:MULTISPECIES: 6-carboxytetrahydropterin synthase [unclassified Paenibacillus]MBP1153974.1 6-pyruvoyltetrahydropterin/6-carboxytetrahydropterin synthase [Paenibacillus sp. PvP091]MBP1170641.1 6-pyruvoyltetrahydropterin/6-carboxytetrahydropterin synthase [Paenibacillus sp. PvR098]MBP2441669.1 6-pyruvoyltetrahydropterin/6-carboxytetrahydropterin synthase [Paenibacillus sp. PvP052]
MLYLSRRVDFSATHVYRVPQWSDEENRRIFGLCNNPSGHGHDYKLEVMAKGLLNESTGIVVNTTDIKRIVNSFVERELDGKFLDREHPYFQIHIPTTESLVEYIWFSLESQFDGCELHRIRLHENDFLYSEKEAGSLTRLTRKYHFCAAHRLHSDHLTAEENLELFGKCNNPHGHGHNYYLDVTVTGTPDPVTGMIMNLAELDEIVERVVLAKFDHKHLNLDTDEFKELNPTSEVVALVIYNMLQPHLPKLYKIGLWETEKNYFEYYGPGE